MSEILDGKATADAIQEEIKQEIAKIQQAGGQVPGLAVIVVGNNPASRVYVNQKKKSCGLVGIHSIELHLPEEVSEDELLGKIKEFNNDSQIHGILVQLPLPKHHDERKVLETILPEKDIDGFHPLNVGRFVTGLEAFVACTPFGVIEMLKRYKIPMKGKRALVIGRSNIVGKPMFHLLLNEHATVTTAHSRTQDLAEEVGRADILVAAIGRPGFVKGEWIKEGAVVVDVGINSIEDPSRPSGRRLVGDVEFDVAKTRASWITPVPGGVGPMTIAMLLANTLKARNIANAGK